MIKDHTRDYATAAFRFYASLGKPSFEELKEKIYNDAIEETKKNTIKTNNICSPTELSIMRAEKAIVEKKAELEDILAVEETLNIIEQLKGKDAIRALETVYFSDPDKELERNEISDRITYISRVIPCSERTVYYYLSEARRIFAERRGLRKTSRRISKVCSSRG